jgi:hypothetical protein
MNFYPMLKTVRLATSATNEVEEVCADLAARLNTLITQEKLFEAGASRHAFVSFVTPEYEWGLLVWLRSLRAISDKPIILLVSREMVVPAELTGIYQLQVPGLYDARFSSSRQEFQHVLSKLWMFALTPLNRVFFVDVDCVFLGRVDDLFEGTDFLVCPDFVVRPERHGFNWCLARLRRYAARFLLRSTPSTRRMAAIRAR